MKKDIIYKLLFVSVIIIFVAFFIDSQPPISYEQIEYDSDINTTILSSELVGNDLILKFYHNSDKAQPIYITADVDYELSKTLAESKEIVTLAVYNWSNEYFELQIGSGSDVFAFGIKILNPYTYLRDNENWIVAFETRGTADLTINSTNANWQEFLTDNPDTFDEMRFLDLECGNVSLKENLQLIDESGNYYDYYQLAENSIRIKKLFLKDYSCEQISYLSNFMLKAGYATIQFTFGDQVVYAYDPPSCDYYINSEDLTETYNITESNSYYCLNTSTGDINYTAINFSVGVQNTTLDCRGFNLDGQKISSTYGVYLTGSATMNNTIKNCNITEFYYGIYLYNGTSQNTIFNNTANSNTYYGIRLEYDSNDNNITNNNFNENDFASIYFYQSSRNIVINNTVSNNDYYGIYFNYSSNNILTNNIANNTDIGIYLYSSSNNTLTNSTANNNSNYGIYLHYSSNNTLTNITANDNTYGIYLRYSSDNILTNNTANSNNLYGIVLFSSSNNNTLTSNIVNSNTYGIYLYYSYSNAIRGGSVASNTQYDYYLDVAGSTNSFRQTNFTSSRKIYFHETSSWFNYNNATANGVWLNTSLFAESSIARELTSWTQSLVQWNDTGTVVTSYNLSGLLPNTNYDLYNNSVRFDNKTTDGNGVLPEFSIDLSGEHEVKIQEAEPPNITINSPTNTTYSSTNITLSYTVWDNSNISACKYEFNNTNTTLANCQNTTFIADEGSNYVKVWANDTANNWNSSVVYFTVDTTGPTVTITAPTNKTYGSTNVSLNYTVSDPNNVSQCKYEFNNTNTTLANCQNTTFIADEGSNTVKVWANDTFNNWNSAVVYFTVDLTGPTITIISPENITYNTTNFTLSYTVWDSNNVSQCVYELNGANTSLINCQNTTIIGARGQNILKLWTNDTLDNWDHSSVNFYLIEDLSITINLPLPNQILHRGMNETLNSTIRNYTEEVTANVTWYNSTTVIGTGEDTKWVVPINYPLGLSTIYVNASRTDSYGESSVDAFCYGFSDVSISAPSSADAGEKVRIECNVTDSNLSIPIENYPVNFYNSTTLIGQNTTNSSGTATYEWDTDNIESGSYELKCQIDDSSDLYYNASLTEATKTIEMNRTIYVTVTQGNNSRVGTLEDVDLTITFYDPGKQSYPEGVSGRIWINKTGVWQGFDCVSNANGNCTIGFRADCSYSDGWTEFIGGVYNDDYYNDMNSSTALIYIDTMPYCERRITFSLEFDMSENQEIEPEGFHKTGHYTCVHDSSLENDPTFGILFAGKRFNYVNSTGQKIELSQYQSGNRFIIPITRGSCSVIREKPAKEFLASPFSSFAPMQSYPIELILSYPIDIVGDFSRSGSFIINLERNETAGRSQIIIGD